MAIRTAEKDDPNKQTELQVESRDEKLARLLFLQTAKLDLENQHESAKSTAKSYAEQVKNTEEQIKKLTREINAGQETLTIVDSESGELDIHNEDEDPVEDEESTEE